MKSSFSASVMAIVRKEFRQEIRGKQAWVQSLLFTFGAVVAATFAVQGLEIDTRAHCGILVVILLFSGLVTLPRIFLAEDERGTLDFLRTSVSADVIFYGKAIFGLTSMGSQGVVAGFLFVIFANLDVVSWAQLLLGIFACAVALASTILFAGLISIGSQQRSLVAAMIGIPLLLPVLNSGLRAIRPGLGPAVGSEMIPLAMSNTVVLFAYGIGLLAFGPMISRVLLGLDSRVAKPDQE